MKFCDFFEDILNEFFFISTVFLTITLGILYSFFFDLGVFFYCFFIFLKIIPKCYHFYPLFLFKLDDMDVYSANSVSIRIILAKK